MTDGKVCSIYSGVEPQRLPVPGIEFVDKCRIESAYNHMVLRHFGVFVPVLIVPHRHIILQLAQLLRILLVLDLRTVNQLIKLYYPFPISERISMELFRKIICQPFCIAVIQVLIK